MGGAERKTKCDIKLNMIPLTDNCRVTIAISTSFLRDAMQSKVSEGYEAVHAVK